MAAIYCAQELCLPITVVVPETTPDFIADKMRSEGATVEVVGKVRCMLGCKMVVQFLVLTGMG